MSEQKPRFMWRAMTSVLIATAFLLLLVSGAVLFISPPGRVANWNDWRIVGLTKHEWSGVHSVFAAVFVLMAVFHVVFNLRPLMNYFRDRFSRRLGWRWEWVVALALCVCVFAGAQLRVPPFSTLLNFGERMKRGWEDPRAAAPLPHAELLSLQELASRAKVSYDTAVERLEARGFKGICPETIVQDLAQTNQVSAQRVYEVIQGPRGGGRGGFGKGGGGGAGWQTLAQYCSSRNVALTNAAAWLQAKGIKLTAEQTLREIALANGYDRPYEVVDILEAAKP